MNDVSNRAVREFSEFLNSIEADFPKPTCTMAFSHFILMLVPLIKINFHLPSALYII